MACCEWEDFKLGVETAFQRHACPSALIDWDRMERCWSRYHCTGAEAASMQLLDMASVADHYRCLQDRHPGEGDDGGLVCDGAPVALL